MSRTLLQSLGAASLVVSLALVAPAQAAGKKAPKQDAPPATVAPTCDHGVQKTLCSRCNPKLASVFKAKGDWCAEHERPESQCVVCHPDLAKKGVK